MQSPPQDSTLPMSLSFNNQSNEPVGEDKGNSDGVGMALDDAMEGSQERNSANLEDRNAKAKKKLPNAMLNKDEGTAGSESLVPAEEQNNVNEMLNSLQNLSLQNQPPQPHLGDLDGGLFRPDGDINFERDFGQWFNHSDDVATLDINLNAGQTSGTASSTPVLQHNVPPAPPPSAQSQGPQLYTPNAGLGGMRGGMVGMTVPPPLGNSLQNPSSQNQPPQPQMQLQDMFDSQFLSSVTSHLEDLDCGLF
ncbi:hypothetical protein PM082_011532 [Marasmius tenuissimus]|nr:hypothetical protein PM082_011532 [Marasmius tenuissimus]